MNNQKEDIEIYISLVSVIRYSLASYE